MTREHIVKFETGHNCIDFKCVNDLETCKPGSGGGHGIHGTNIRFVVKGKEGVVQFLLYTGWIPGRDNEYNQKCSPMAADLGYHSLKPLYEGQSIMQDHCPYECERESSRLQSWVAHLDGKPCYYDGSVLNAIEAFKTLVDAGEDDLYERAYNIVESLKNARGNDKNNKGVDV